MPLDSTSSRQRRILSNLLVSSSLTSYVIPLPQSYPVSVQLTSGGSSSTWNLSRALSFIFRRPPTPSMILSAVQKHLQMIQGSATGESHATLLRLLVLGEMQLTSVTPLTGNDSSTCLDFRTIW